MSDRDPEFPAFDLEQIYDEQIFPLMRQIADICTRHKLPMVAAFQYQRIVEPNADHGSDGFCTTVILPEERRPADRLVRFVHTMFPDRQTKITTTKADGTVVDQTLIIELDP